MEYIERHKAWKDECREKYRMPGMDLVAFRLSDMAKMPPAPEPKDGDTWGHWRLKTSSLVLTHDDSEHRSTWGEFDLETCLNSASVPASLLEMLDVFATPRAPVECLGHLVKALVTILKPRHNISFYGREQKDSKERIRKILDALAVSA